jgi:hypothetical protein
MSAGTVGRTSMDLMVRRIGLSLAIWSIFGSVVGCAPGLRWVHDPPNLASCVPDRLPTWEDFVKRPVSGRHGAETAIRFVLFRQPARIQAQFDHEHSWVRPEVAYSPNGSEHLLRHEQLHFAIGCLLAREANAALQSSGEPEAMLLLVNAVATRLNVQYDSESNHGLNAEDQARWEKAIQARLKAGPLTKGP